MCVNSSSVLNPIVQCCLCCVFSHFMWWVFFDKQIKCFPILFVLSLDRKSDGKTKKALQWRKNLKWLPFCMLLLIVVLCVQVPGSGRWYRSRSQSGWNWRRQLWQWRRRRRPLQLDAKEEDSQCCCDMATGCVSSVAHCVMTDQTDICALLFHSLFFILFLKIIFD